MRVTLTSIVLIIGFVTFCNKLQSQDLQIKQFWEKSDYTVATQSLSTPAKITYFRAIHEFYPHRVQSEVFATGEKIRTDTKLQDYIFLNLLLDYGNSDILRLVVGDICSNHALGNYVSNYIVNKYSKDKRYLDRLMKKTILSNERKAEEKIIQEEDSLKIAIDANEIITAIEQEADFPGGIQQWMKYLNHQLDSLDLAQQFKSLKINPTDGIVVQFIITRKGLLDSIKINPPVNPEFDRQVISIFKNSPKWEPTLHNGKPVIGYRKQPLKFDDDDEL